MCMKTCCNSIRNQYFSCVFSHDWFGLALSSDLRFCTGSFLFFFLLPVGTLPSVKWSNYIYLMYLLVVNWTINRYIKECQYVCISLHIVYCFTLSHWRCKQLCVVVLVLFLKDRPILSPPTGVESYHLPTSIKERMHVGLGPRTGNTVFQV